VSIFYLSAMIVGKERNTMQIETTCKNCGKKFEKHTGEEFGDNRDSLQDICYDCALESTTGGQPPEEGDFNTARITSGEISEEERRLLQEDLRSVDWAACQPDPEDDEHDHLDEE